ncbi:MAG: riboflavin synthase [Gammaproteobacteria bacterium]|jgi:riboflavin synthase
MFTGIINATGSVSEILDCKGDKTFLLDTGDLEINDVMLGDSICINGVCLTVINKTDKSIKVDVSAETLLCTNFDEYLPGKRVNLEKSLQTTDRLHGHIVSGHVDTVGIIVSIKNDARSFQYNIEIPVEFRKYLCKKGSVCVDGVSLTINDISEKYVSLNIIPYTKLNTIFSDYISGSKVNIEVDIIARYLETLHQL